MQARSRRRIGLRAAGPFLLALALAVPAAAQNHDLVLKKAPAITAPASPTSSTDWQSPDIKLGAEFNDNSVPDTVRRGVTIPVFARFYINGVLEHTLSSGDVELRFHYRDAMVGEMPPDLGAPGAGWTLIDTLPVTFDPMNPLALTNTWPANYPMASPTHVDWAVPAAGDFFHVRAEVVHPAGTTDANPDDNVAVSLYDSILGMRDVDLVIVHDLSGSMLTNTYMGDTYLAHAQSRASAFVLSMNGDHRLAVVGFGGCIPGGVSDVWGTPVPPLKPATPANKIAAVNAITGLAIPHAGCATPMGPGLQRARQILTSEALDPTRKRAVLLLTDGYDNSGTPRACPDTDPAGACIGTPVLAQLQADGIRVFSIALGGAADTDCLVCLTDETGGEWYSTPGPGLNLAEVFHEMQQAYSADDLYRIDRGVTGGGDDSYQTHFEGLDDVLYFILQSDDLDAQVDLELRRPGGPWQSPAALAGASVHRDRGYVVVRVEGPAAGTWGYRVLGERRESYLVAVRSDRVGVRLAFDVKTEGRVGEPIFIHARVTARGEPIQEGDVTARVQVPVGSSFDSILRRASRRFLLERGRSPIDLRRGEDVSPRVALINHITDGRQHRVLKSRTVEVPLEPGRDGSFTGVFSGPTNIAGAYRVTVSYRGETADRQYSKTVRLAPAGLDFDGTFAELLRLKDPSGARTRWLVRIYPTDEAGNAVTDRRLLKSLDVSVRGARPQGEPQVAFDGAFEQVLRVPDRRPPILERVTIRGKEIRIERRSPGDPR